MMKTSESEPEYCQCLMPLGSKTCHHCKKPVKPVPLPTSAARAAAEECARKSYEVERALDASEVEAIILTHCAGPDGEVISRAEAALLDVLGKSPRHKRENLWDGQFPQRPELKDEGRWLRNTGATTKST